MNITEGDYVLVRLDAVDGHEVQISSGLFPLPNPSPRVINDIDPSRLEAYVGEEVPVEIVSTDGFDPEIRVLLPELVSRDHQIRSEDQIPIPGETTTQRFDQIRANGRLVGFDMAGLNQLRSISGIPGALLEVRILQVYRHPFDSGYVGFGEAIDILEQPSAGMEIDIVHKPATENRNGNIDLHPRFAVPKQYPVRYETTPAFCDRTKFSTDDLKIVDTGVLPIRGKEFHAELRAGEDYAIVPRDDNTEDVPEDLVEIADEYISWDGYRVQLLEPSHVNGTAKIVIRESKPDGSLRAELKQVTSVRGIEDSEFTEGTVVRAKTAAGETKASIQDSEVDIELETKPAVSTEIEARVTGIEDGKLQGEIVDPKKLPRTGNTITVEYSHRGTEIPVEGIDYSLELDSPPLFTDRARVELVGEFDPDERTISAEHVEYLSYPDVGDRLIVNYDSQTGVCVDPETGLSVEANETLEWDGKIEIRLQENDGEPVGKIVDYKTVPLEGNVVPAEVNYGSEVAVTDQGYEIDLDSASLAAGTVGVEVAKIDKNRIYGSIDQYRLGYLDVGSKIRESLKYQTKEFEYDRETPKVKIALEGPAPSTGIFEIEITEIEDVICGRITEEKESLQTDNQTSGSTSRRINLGVSSSVL